MVNTAFINTTISYFPAHYSFKCSGGKKNNILDKLNK